MKTFTKICMVSSLVLMFGGMAFATGYDCPPGPGSCTPAVWNASVDNWFPQTDQTINFDLTQYNLFFNPNPYKPGVDTITSALLNFDVQGKSFHTDTFNLLVGTPATTLSYSFSASDDSFKYTLTGTLLYDLQQDGKIKVVFDGTGNCPAELDSICLTANGFDNCPVPEPGTVLLFGIGVFGVALYGKRRMKIQ